MREIRKFHESKQVIQRKIEIMFYREIKQQSLRSFALCLYPIIGTLIYLLLFLFSAAKDNFSKSTVDNKSNLEEEEVAAAIAIFKSYKS